MVLDAATEDRQEAEETSAVSVRDGLKVLIYGGLIITLAQSAVSMCSTPAVEPYTPPPTAAEREQRRADRQREKANLARSGPRPSGPSRLSVMPG